MKLGAEPKKIAALVGLLAVAAVVFMINSNSGVPQSSSPQAGSQAVVVNPGGAAVTAERETAPRPTARGRGGTEFRPSLRPKRGEERTDPANIDPTLRLDVLAKLQQVEVEGTRRSIFDFSQPPPPKPDPKQVAAAKTPVPSPLVKAEAKEPEKAAEPVKPQAPPVPLKFYGYLTRTNQPAKRAFFIEGEDIHVVSEGDMVKKRYKVVRIGVNSVVVEDTQFGQQQTLPLEEQPG